MSGNERIPDALDDYDTLIRGGVSVDEAVNLAASENDLKPEVVRFRARKAFGDLDWHRKDRLRTLELRAERRAAFQPLADKIEAVYASGSQLSFIPIGRFVRENFVEGLSRDEAFEFARDYHKKWQS